MRASLITAVVLLAFYVNFGTNLTMTREQKFAFWRHVARHLPIVILIVILIWAGATFALNGPMFKFL